MCNQCEFPGCTRGAAKDSIYCINHRKIYGEKPKPKAKQKPIPKRSLKMQKEMKLYKPQVKAYLERPENQVCLIQSPVCTKKATSVNHKKRRGNNLRNEKYFEPCCAPCNIYIETHTHWAEQNGHLIPVHKNEVDPEVFETPLELLQTAS